MLGRLPQYNTWLEISNKVFYKSSNKAKKLEDNKENCQASSYIILRIKNIKFAIKLKYLLYDPIRNLDNNYGIDYSLK